MDNQYSSKFSFNETTLTNTVLENVIYGTSGAVYYAASDGTTAIFGKDDDKGNKIWAKSYQNHNFRSNSFVVSKDEKFMYTIEEENISYLQILKINATNGDLITQYRRY